MGAEKIKTFRDLLVWQKSIEFVTSTYINSRSFPKDEIFGLTQQLRRAVVSIPSNIAEGYGRKSTKDYIRFLQIAIGSLFEVQTQLQIALNLEYLKEEDSQNLFESSREIERMLSSLIKKLN